MSCAVCGSDRAQLVARMKDDRYLRAMHIAPAVATKVMCGACGHIYENPQLEASELETLYRRVYRSAALGYEAAAPSETYLYWKRLKAERDDRWLARHAAAPRAGLRVLEIGCAEGSLLARLAQDGCRVVGVEATESYADYGRRVHGLDIRAGTFEDAPLADERFDLVIALKVLEHAKNPLRFARKIAGVLAPGGALYLTVPNALRPDQTPQEFLASVHLSLFTEPSLRGLLRRAGLEAAHVDDADRYLAVLARPASGAPAVECPPPVPVGALRRTIRRYRVRSRVEREASRLRRLAKRGVYGLAGRQSGDAIWHWLKARAGRS